MTARGLASRCIDIPSEHIISDIPYSLGRLKVMCLVSTDGLFQLGLSNRFWKEQFPKTFGIDERPSLLLQFGDQSKG